MRFKKIAWISLVVLLIAAGSIFFLNKSKETNGIYSTAFIQRENLTQTVSETGIIKSNQEINLNFLNDGKIEDILVQVGEKVEKDQILASLEKTSLILQEQEALAQVEIAKAELKKLTNGANLSEINVLESTLKQAETNYQMSLKELEKTQANVAENIQQVQKTHDDLINQNEFDLTTYEQAVTLATTNLENTKNTYLQNIQHKKASALKNIVNNLVVINFALDNILKILDDEDLKSVLSVKNSFYLNETKTSYQKTKDLFDKLSPQIKQASQEDEIEILLESSLELLNQTSQSLNLLYSVLENSVTSSTFTQTNLDNLKSTINTQSLSINNNTLTIQNTIQNLNDAVLQYETNLKTAENNLLQAQVSLDNAILTAKNNLKTTIQNGEQQILLAESKVANNLKAWEVSQAQLKQIKAPARAEDVLLAKAQIKRVEAILENVRENLRKNTLKAPIDGIVTKISYEVGEKTSINQPILSLLGENHLEIEVDISESDINKIHENNPVLITLDAFDEDVKFHGTVVSIEPAETIIQDVIYYKIKIQFEKLKQTEYQIKPGMSADTTITTAIKKDVLTIPSRAIIDKNGSGKFVRILKNGEPIEIPIKIGLRGDDGLVELIEGLEEGDEIVTYVKN